MRQQAKKMIALKNRCLKISLFCISLFLLNSFSMASDQISQPSQPSPTSELTGEFTTTETAKAAIHSYQVRAGKIAYSLENILNGNVVKDLDHLSNAVGAGLIPMIAAEVALRFESALKLIIEISKDTSLTKTEKRALLEKSNLAPILGEIFIKTIRQHGDDKVDTEKVVTSKVGLKEVTHDLVSSLTDLVTKIPTVGHELDPNREKVHEVPERIIRDLLSQDLIILLQKAIVEIGDIEGEEKADDYIRKILLDKPNNTNPSHLDEGAASIALRIREKRYKAYKITMGVLGTLAAAQFIQPVDFVGALPGMEYSESTLNITDFSIYASMVTLGLIKKATGAYNTIPGLKKLIEIVKNPEAKQEFSKMKYSLASRLFGLRKKYAEARSTLENHYSKQPVLIDHNGEITLSCSHLFK